MKNFLVLITILAFAIQTIANQSATSDQKETSAKSQEQKKNSNEKTSVDEILDETDFDPKDEADQIKKSKLNAKKLEEFVFMQNIFCFIGTQRYLSRPDPIIKKIKDNKDPKQTKKFLATIISRCQNDLLREDTMESLNHVQSKEDMEKFEFPFFKEFNLEEFLNLKDFELTKEEEENLENFEKTQKKFQKMRDEKKDSKSSKASTNLKGEEAEIDSDERKRKKIEAAKKSKWFTYPIFFAVIGFFIILAKFALKSTQPIEKESKKDKKKKA